MTSYATQIDNTGNGHERCAAATVATMLLDAGWDSDPYGLMLEVTGRIWGESEPRGATSQDVINVLGQYGFQAQTWSGWQEALDALGDPNPHYVACLLDNWYLRPRPYPAGPSWNALHWIRLKQLLDNEEMAYLYDPLTYLPTGFAVPYEGPTVATTESLRQGIANSPVWEAGVIAWREAPDEVAQVGPEAMAPDLAARVFGAQALAKLLARRTVRTQG